MLVLSHRLPVYPFFGPGSHKDNSIIVIWQILKWGIKKLCGVEGAWNIWMGPSWEMNCQNLARVCLLVAIYGVFFIKSLPTGCCYQGRGALWCVPEPADGFDLPYSLVVDPPSDWLLQSQVIGKQGPSRKFKLNYKSPRNFSGSLNKCVQPQWRHGQTQEENWNGRED